MALVLLPCDLPTWPAVQRHLNLIKSVETAAQLIDGMQKLHAICCISLDPDEDDRSDIEMFSGLQLFLDAVLNDNERKRFFQVTLSSLLTFALRLKLYKPINGLRYSLQQQGDCSELDRRFLASLVANAFFSTFPRRTLKTHPTLQDCNFARFFVHLKSSVQQKKFRQFLAYFELIAFQEPRGKVVFIRQVMPKKAELDLSDWLQCDKTLCPVVVHHEGRVEQAEFGSLKVCFVSDRMGGRVLDGGDKNEDVMFSAFPELFVTLLSMEVLEYNEACTVHGLLPITELLDHRENLCFPQPLKDLVAVDRIFNTHICLIDFQDYNSVPESQYLGTSIVRELNKTFAGFRQQPMSYMRIPPMGKSCSSTPPEDPAPIGDVIEEEKESLANDLPLTLMKSLMAKRGGLCSLVNQMIRHEEPAVCGSEREECATPDCGSFRTLQGSPCNEDVNATECRSSVTCKPIATVGQLLFGRRQAQELLLEREDSDESMYRDCEEDHEGEDSVSSGGLAFQRPLRLGQNCPKPMHVTSTIPRLGKATKKSSLEGAAMDASFISCQSHVSSSGSDESDDFDEDDDEEGFKSCSEEVDDEFPDNYTASRRTTVAVSELPLDFEAPFGRRILKDSMNKRARPSVSRTETDDSSYAVDSDIVDPDLLRDTEGFLLRRTTSTGFMLDEDEDIFLGDGLEHEREWLAHFRHRSTNPSRSLSRRNSSRYSFSSDFSSDLEDIYEHFEEKMTEGPVWDDPAFSCRLGDRLKRTLSDSLTSFPRVTVGVPRSLSLTEKMQQERLNIEYAKQSVANTDRDPPQVHSVAVGCHGDMLGITTVSRTEVDVDKSSETIGQLVGTTNVVIERNLSDVEENVTLPLPLSHSRLPSQLSVWWNYNSMYDFCVPLNQFKTSHRSITDDGEDSSCVLTIVTNNYTDLDRSSPRRSFNLEVIEENPPGNSSDTFADLTITSKLDDGEWINGFGGVNNKSMYLLHLLPPPQGVYRSKSASNSDELARISRKSIGTLLSQEITRSCSLKDMKELNRLSCDIRTTVQKAEICVQNEQPKLKKWQAAFNLSDLDKEELNGDQVPAKPTESESIPPSSKTKAESVPKILNGGTVDSEDTMVGYCSARDVDAHWNLNTQKQIVTEKLGSFETNTNCVRNSLTGLRETISCVSSSERQQAGCNRLLEQILENDGGFRPIVTGNWNCGDGSCVDPQLKVLIQWMAASKADAPCITYYTGGDHRIVKFNVISRLLLDRRWSVSHIAKAIISYCKQSHRHKSSDNEDEELDLFESLLPKETDL